MNLGIIPIDQLKPAPWNPNQMDDATLGKLKQSIRLYGIVENLVVRKLSDGNYQVLSGNQRLKILFELGFKTVPCHVVEVDDGKARLLAQALNHIHGQDDLGLRADLMKELLKTIPEADVLAILPETAVSLKSLTSMRQMDIASYLQNWQRAQDTKLKTMQFRLTRDQEKTVEEAINKMLSRARESQICPNVRGTALYILCKTFLQKESE